MINVSLHNYKSYNRGNKMNPKKMLSELVFVNEVSSKKQTYYIYSNKAGYILMTISKTKENSCNLVVVPHGAPEYVQRIFKGKQKITAAEILAGTRKPEYIKSTFNVLNALYVLCAQKKANIDHRFKGRALYFSIKK